ncbi:ATPase [Thioclava dalianensis]|uniref:P-type Cu(2+) transporter n=1 Tax=Thioclava dalianensis TaxID=1185766 RepID=A0A074TER0_9RHOB|nr:heavy metal translocating P-type ATPase [Thioclava dalianensis]KEP70226.1 ATPase [Thioclava dalianensis]SFM82409.1 Cu+-exporting ATPase [Thioclava dalianensis]
MQKTTFTIDAMHCGACTGRVERALLAQPGVSSASANLMARTASVEYEAPADPANLSAALSEAGYPPSDSSIQLDIDGMTCASCAGRVERALTALPGVSGAHVNLATNSARVDFAQGVLDPEDLTRAVAEAGYRATPRREDASAPSAAERQAQEGQALKRNFLTALILTLPVFVLAMGSHMIPGMHHLIAATIGERTSWVIQGALTALVLAFPGRIFLRIGIPALLRGAPEMNSLVALGSLAAFAFSTVVTLAPSLIPASARGVYFEAAATIVTLILLGRWLEARAKGRAGEAISRLIGLQPDTARVQTETGIEERPIAELRAGDVLLLSPGERVALDGVVCEGQGHVDESMLTGEPVPVEKTEGSPITGGTVNGSSALSYRVTATGGDTVLARIISMVEDAQGAKLPVQGLVDKVTRVFVPIVMALSVVTFAIWMLAGEGFTPAFVAAVSVMIIACPCAMGLATPVSILVGTGRGAELGLLFRRGDALQRLAEVKVIGFDKTGTLTQGTPALTDLYPLSDLSENEILALAAGAEARSEHPLARAILSEAEARDIAHAPVKRVKALSGRGLRAQSEQGLLWLGNARAMQEAGVDISAHSARAAALAEQGRTPVWMALDDRPVALMALSDPIKPEARAAIRALHAAGVEVAMITGDTKATAQAVARALGIDHVQAEVLPDGKRDAVETLRAKGPVGFVGDGINDAPALAAADVGLAIGSGTDVAIEAAEVVLMGGDPTGVVRALQLSRAVMRNIRENLFWAFAYNVVLIPVAMGLLVPFGGPGLSPMLAAAAMAFSSVFVVSNALRLRRAARG